LIYLLYEKYERYEMVYETFEKKFDNLKKNNVELIDEYEDKTNEAVFDSLPDLYESYNKYIKLKPQTDASFYISAVIRYSLSNDIPLSSAAEALTSKAMLPDAERGTLQQYFRDVSKAYDKNGNNYNIEYCEENRDKLIEMNLKTVISIAKGYQGLGLSLEELISAGNYGLIESFKKYDPNRAKLKEDMLEALEELPENANGGEIINKIQQYLKYGGIRKKFVKAFASIAIAESTEQKNDDELKDMEATPIPSNWSSITWKPFMRNDVIAWVKHNVKNATFNSVAFMWIRAYILIEIDNYSRLVKKPKSDIYNDKLKYGSYRKEVTLDIDAPIGDDNDTKFSDILNMEDDHVSDMEAAEAYDIFKNGLDKLLDGVKPRDRSVFLKKFGIGMPRELEPKEIAAQEGLSIARISQILQSVIEQMQRNQVKYNINPDVLFDAVSKIN